MFHTETANFMMDYEADANARVKNKGTPCESLEEKGKVKSCLISVHIKAPVNC